MSRQKSVGSSSYPCASAPTYDAEPISGEGGPRPQKTRTGVYEVYDPLDKATFLRRLRSLNRRVNKIVDWSCNTAEIKRDDLILDLHSLLVKAIYLLPEDDDEVIIRWQPQDIRDAAAEMGLRLSRKAARDLLSSIRRTLEEASISAGWDVINERLEDLEERPRAASKASGRKSAKAQSAQRP